MHRSRSRRRLQRVTPKRRSVIHYRRRANSMPHCAICKAELNGITLSRSGGRSRRTNSRLFGGVLCAKCTSDIVKAASRIEQGNMKLNDIGIGQRAFVLQMLSH
ncbi:MAG: 50S ribosomal protein L34e [Candidatus Marsarchaeota archaeon]|nr:50S ribosomal protein L34e [Candidatus Marsarchaeota archaeon]